MQSTSRAGLITCVSFVLVIGFAACGAASGALSPNSGQGSGVTVTGVASTVTIAKRTPVPTTPVPTTPAATATSSLGSPTGRVTVTLGATHYAPTDTIGVTIDNGTTASISTADHQTECKEVSLQQLVNGAWQTQRECPLLSPTRLVILAPGITPQPLAPGSTPWPAGTYRVAFAYFVGADAGSGTGQASAQGQEQLIYSTDFSIG